MANRILAFLAEWFDPQAQHVKTFRLNFYPDNTIELIDIELKRTTLKRIYCPDIPAHRMYVGSSINLYAKQLHLVDYADEGTSKYMQDAQGCGFAFLLPPESTRVVGRVLEDLNESGFVLARAKTVWDLPFPGVDQAWAEAVPSAAGGAVENALRTAVDLGVEQGATVPAIAMELMAPPPAGGFVGWVQAAAKMAEIYGSSAFHFPDNQEEARQASMFFLGVPGRFPPTRPVPAASQTTLCLVKPHAVEGGKGGCVVSAILEAGFQIGALEQFFLNNQTATEFFDVYRDVIPDYMETLNHLTEGPVLALMIEGDNVVEHFREFCGPVDVEVAKTLRPDSLRARFGKDRVKNAVHCTDLPEDGDLECKYFFETLTAV